MWKTGYERTALPRQRQTRRKAGTQSHGPFPNPPGSSAGRQVTERVDGIPEVEERTPERTEIPHQRFSQTSPLDAPSGSIVSVQVSIPCHQPPGFQTSNGSLESEIAIMMKQ